MSMDGVFQWDGYVLRYVVGYIQKNIERVTG